MATTWKAVHATLFHQKTHDAVTHGSLTMTRSEDRIEARNPPGEGELVRSSIRDAVKAAFKQIQVNAVPATVRQCQNVFSASLQGPCAVRAADKGLFFWRLCRVHPTSLQSTCFLFSRKPSSRNFLETNSIWSSLISASCSLEEDFNGASMLNALHIARC